jgi:hypothetical protein
MNQQPQARPDQRRSRRKSPKGSTRVRCYKGPMGLGPNLGVAVLDVSETGVRLVVKADLPPGQEIEVNFDNVAARPIKMLAEVIWSMPTTNGNFCVGASFHKPIGYGDLLALARS